MATAWKISQWLDTRWDKFTQARKIRIRRVRIRKELVGRIWKILWSENELDEKTKAKNGVYIDSAQIDQFLILKFINIT